MFSQRRAQPLVINAFPWRLGGVLINDGMATSYISDPVSQRHRHARRGHRFSDMSADRRDFGHALVLARVGKHTSAMQVNGCGSWRQRHNVVSGEPSRGSSTALNVIAREVEFEVAAASYRPMVAEHITGVAIVTADALSRVHKQDSQYSLPQCSRDVPQAPIVS